MAAQRQADRHLHIDTRLFTSVSLLLGHVLTPCGQNTVTSDKCWLRCRLPTRHFSDDHLEVRRYCLRNENTTRRIRANLITLPRQLR